MNAATFAARLAANQAFVHFDLVLAADGVTLGTNHTRSELVENLEGGLITRERKLALKLDRGLSGDLRGHQICAPEPCRERRVAGLHDSASRQRRVGLAAAAAQHHGRTGFETIRLAHNAAFWTRKSARPTNGFEVARASRVVRKNPLKLGKRCGETANIHGRDNGRFSRPCQATG